MKICSHCKSHLDISQFNKNSKSKDGLFGRCRACTRAATKSWFERNKERARRTSADWKKNNPDIVKTNNKKWQLKNKFNLSEQQYEDMLVAQGFSCKICSKHQDELVKKLAVDHCHITGKIRGLLCSNCNIYLGYIKENTVSANNLLDYLYAHKIH